MTFGWRNVLAIEGDITYRFSIAGVSQRHSLGSAGRVRQLFNASWRETRELVALAEDGEGAYLVRAAALALPIVAAVAGEPYAVIPWPTDAIGVGMVRVQVNGTRWYGLKRASFLAIHDYQNLDTFAGYSPNRSPVIYASRIAPDGVGNTETSGEIMIAPIPTAGNYALWYLQGWQDRIADSDTIPGMANWIEHAVLSTCIRMAQPDSDSQKQVQIWMIERNRIEAQITARAQKMAGSLPLEPRDARGDGYDSNPYGGQL